ncbi:LysR family transcriptional regulator [Vagococcus sp. PNs007]|uniref:LysR family transcriptional regulator n=1 Tax=Vagococcus proximus TaxID=2991417 RepID=A0ABT5WZS7_9ENTE|nr:LysR family transcriptional regulator [Vagococcus proximus]MDF0479248.1 LysR family transcriptional regulator [Vagococcus proximus]
MLDTRYETFLTLCHEKNYTKTAEKLFITQPAVSQHIKWLEERYNTKLVNYKQRQLTLTPGGQKLYDYLINLKAQISKIEADIITDDKKSPPLNFSVTLSISDYYLPRIMADFTTRYPHSNIACHVENTQHIIKKLQSGAIDFALVEGNFPKELFTSHKLSTEPFIGVCGKDFPIELNQTYSIDDLYDFPLIIREDGSGSRLILEHLLAEQNSTVHDFERLLSVGNLPTTKNLVADNHGITFLYETVVKEDLENMTLKRIPLRSLETAHNFYFIYLKDSLFSVDYDAIFTHLQPLFKT